MKTLRHCWWAIRYGEWHCGWKMYKDKPKFGFYHFYYDGNCAGFHLYKFWLSVRY